MRLPGSTVVPVTAPVAAVLAMAFVLSACESAPGPAADKPQRISTALPAAAARAQTAETPLSRALFAEIGEARGDLPRLQVDASLTRAAAVHSADMAERGFVGHHNPDGQGPLERMLAINAGFRARVGENIAVRDTLPFESAEETAEKIVEAWMRNPRHRNTLLSPAYDRTGLGIAEDGGRVYVTQIFAGP